MLNPLGHRVLIKQDKLEDTDPTFNAAKKAGIALPQNLELEREQAAVDKGVIVAIGHTCWQDPTLGGVPWAAVGDYVYFAKYAGRVITDPVDKEKYILINDEDLIAKVTDNG